MEKQKVKTKKNIKRRVVLITAILIVVLLFDVFMVGNVNYAVKWIQCGRRPVVVNLSTGVRFGAEPSVVTIRENPGFFDAKDVPFPFIDSTLYCSVDEAKASISSNVQIQYK